jgi:uncharacterized protein (DUF1697 family)
MKKTPAPTAQSGADGSYVALLRGVNVGGKNMLPMPSFVSILSEAGCRDVATYIQSGNAVFRATESLAASLPRLVAARIARKFGLEVPVVVRSGEELAAISRRNPLLGLSTDVDTLMVMFLADRPSPEQIALLDTRRSPPDEFQVRGQEIFLRCPNGFARTKLTNAYFDSRLKTTSTGRNWRTVLKLRDMAADLTS